jgi:gamma-glutamyltranspeptidase / glutathione hydrolase
MKGKSKFLLLLSLSAAVVATAFAQRQYEHQAKYPSRGLHGAVSAGTDYATDAGMQALHNGGNAVDAGVAAMFAAASTEYSHFGWGGEAPILIRTKDGKVHSIAGVGTMPKLATADFFRKRKLQPGEITSPPEKGGLSGVIPVAGIMSALVPSMVDAGLLALRDFGTKSFSEEVAQAIDLADGAGIDELRAGTIAHDAPYFDVWPYGKFSKSVFTPNGHIPATGEIFRQPDLARTLRAMAAAEKKALGAGKSRVEAIDAVRDYFYRGEIAKKIDAFVRESGGLLRYDDLASFHLEPEEALSTNFKGYEVYKPGFWSQGPTMIQALNILNGYDLGAMRYNSAAYLHTLTEALKLAYADRDTYYGDPKFNKLPTETLLSMQYAAERRALIGPNASLEFRPGHIGKNPPVHPSLSEITRVKIDDELMAKDTTCVDAIDKDGVMFSATPSGAWMPSVIAGDTGIPLTERAQSFLLVPGNPNELAGGKRPRVTLSPTIVTKDGKPFLALSTPGGDNQEQSLVQVLLNVVIFHMDAEIALEAPRFQTRHLVSSFDNHAMSPGDLLLDDRISPAVMEELAAKGHRVGTRTRWSSGAAPVAIRVTPGGVIEAGADPYGYRSARAW